MYKNQISSRKKRQNAPIVDELQFFYFLIMMTDRHPVEIDSELNCH